MEITGILESILETEAITATFKKRDFIIKTDQEQYPQLIKFQLINDKVNVIDNHSVGDLVKVSFDIRGNQASNGTVYNNLNAWAVYKG